MSPTVMSVIWRMQISALKIVMILVEYLKHKWNLPTRLWSTRGACGGIFPTSASQVTACSSSWKEPSVQRGCCSAGTRTCSSDPFREHIGLSILKDDMSYTLAGFMSDACESGFNGMKKQSFRLSFRPELYIGFMLHLVAFALPELFVSLGAVAVGIVLRWLE